MRIIKINRNCLGDTRTATHMPSWAEFEKANWDHRFDVRNISDGFSEELMNRVEAHDWTKTKAPYSSIPDMWNSCNTLSLEMEVSNKYINKARDITDLISMLFGEDIKLEPIKKVIFNNPATIILWLDGTKTVVKCQDGEQYDPEKGLAMALVKKMCGNKGNYYNIFTKVFKKFGPGE